jgi:hypothetical protein
MVVLVDVGVGNIPGLTERLAPRLCIVSAALQVLLVRAAVHDIPRLLIRLPPKVGHAPLGRRRNHSSLAICRIAHVLECPGNHADPFGIHPIHIAGQRRPRRRTEDHLIDTIHRLPARLVVAYIAVNHLDRLRNRLHHVLLRLPPPPDKRLDSVPTNQQLSHQDTPYTPRCTHHKHGRVFCLRRIERLGQKVVVKVCRGPARPPNPLKLRPHVVKHLPRPPPHGYRIQIIQLEVLTVRRHHGIERLSALATEGDGVEVVQRHRFRPLPGPRPATTPAKCRPGGRLLLCVAASLGGFCILRGVLVHHGRVSVTLLPGLVIPRSGTNTHH